MTRTAIISILDGNAAGCHECAVEGWMGVAFRIPRTLLPDGKARKKYEDACSELTQSGVYFLFGKTEKGEKSVYVGKAERRIDPRTNETNGVLFRVMQRHSNKKDPAIADRWEEAVMIVSDNEKRLQMKHYIDFLENKFYRLAKNSEETDPHGYKVLNNSMPQRGDHTPDVDRNFSVFIECANTALIALGYYVLEPLPLGKVVVDPPKPPKDEPVPDSCTLGDKEAILTGRHIVKFRYLEHEQSVSSWADMFEQVVKMLHQRNKSILSSLAEQNSGLGKYVSSSGGKLRRAMKIDDRVYVEVNTPTKNKISQLRQLFDLYEIDKTALTFFYRSKS